MREIDRSRYLRGTKAWTVRNWFVFGGLAITVTLGAAAVLLFPKERVLQKMEEEKVAKVAKREKIDAILRHREELKAEKMPDKKD